MAAPCRRSPQKSIKGPFRPVQVPATLSLLGMKTKSRPASPALWKGRAGSKQRETQIFFGTGRPPFDAVSIILSLAEAGSQLRIRPYACCRAALLCPFQLSSVASVPSFFFLRLVLCPAPKISQCHGWEACVGTGTPARLSFVIFVLVA